MSALRPSLIEFSYLVAVSLFIVGLHYLRTPRTARKGNLCASLGMLLAVLATFIDRDVLSYELLGIGLIVGALVGATVARWVPMTAMPQMVGLLNGFGGGASALVAVGQYLRLMQQAPADWSMATTCTIVLGVLIGGATFSGSMVAFGKLQELIVGRALTFPGQQALQILLLLAFVAGGTYLLLAPNSLTVFLILVGLALLFGGLFVLPIGAADMPVVISLLNSCSGLAASATGFVIRNDLLIIAGALVGASGLILTHMMCKAMNRSLAHVLFGSLGSGGARAGAVGQMEKVTHSIDAEEAAMMLAYARAVVIVPGYGMAVAQAQHAVHELSQQLSSHGVEVRYAIHPVAGRMPGHMNVLLAEANVPYTDLVDMDDINPEFEHTDVALVIGANDIVNPSARNDPSSPIYGMPILDVDKARHVIVIKRSLNPGFAGIDNALFYHDRTLMLFGDARSVVNDLINEVKQL